MAVFGELSDVRLPLSEWSVSTIFKKNVKFKSKKILMYCKNNIFAVKP